MPMVTYEITKLLFLFDYLILIFLNTYFCRNNHHPESNSHSNPDPIQIKIDPVLIYESNSDSDSLWAQFQS